MSNSNSLHPWSGFLPKKALVMARSLPEPQDVLEVLLREESPTPPAELPPLFTDSHEKIAIDLKECSRCKLCQKRNTIVLGEGSPTARLVFVGEGPGEQEDLQGRPFVGKAGQLLDRMIAAIGLKREEVFIANVVKCRPPGNRNPEPDEIQTCSPFLFRQLDLIRPEVIVALGKFAAQTLLQTEERISTLRGRFHSYRGTQLMPTFHPSYLLRNPSSKREAWEDLQKVAHHLKLEIPQRK